MNKIVLIGNLTRDPETAKTPNGIAVCKFSIAVSRRFANAAGETETDFFNVTAWRGVAENCGKYLKKGNKACVVGSVQMYRYEGKDGVKRTAVEVIAEDVEFLTPKFGVEKEERSTPKSAGSNMGDAPSSKAAPKKAQSVEDLEPADAGELPF